MPPLGDDTDLWRCLLRVGAEDMGARIEISVTFESSNIFTKFILNLETFGPARAWF